MSMEYLKALSAEHKYRITELNMLKDSLGIPETYENVSQTPEYYKKVRDFLHAKMEIYNRFIQNRMKTQCRLTD